MNSSSLRWALLWVLGILAYTSLGAQHKIVVGKIVDEDHKPMAFANVKLLNNKGNMITGVSTNQQGQYKIKAVAPGSYRLQVTFVSYNMHEQLITVPGDGDETVRIKDVVMGMSEGKELKAVTVTAKATEIIVRNDTLEYNADSYTMQKGAVLNDLIKKLPGATVNDDGTISVNGKTIKKIMVDGKEFFSSDPKVASKNLPAELVDKLQVLDRASDNSRMTGFDDGDEETIINLTIKPDRKKGLFGTAYAGYGNKDRYETNVVVNRFNGNNQWTILGGMNNTNNMGFSDISQDLSQASFMSGVTGGRRGLRDGITASKVLGFNGNFTLTPTLILGGNSFAGHSNKDQYSDILRQNFLKDGSTTTQEYVTNVTKSDSWGSELRMVWKPDTLTEIIVVPEVSWSRSHNLYADNYTTINDADGALVNKGDVMQDTQGESKKLNLAIDASRKLNDKGRTLALNLRMHYGDDDNNGIYNALLESGSGNILNKLNQKLVDDKKSGGFRIRWSWVEPLGKNYFIQGLYQLKTDYNHSVRNAFSPDASGEYIVPAEIYSNEFKNESFTHRFGLSVKKKGDKYDLTAGFNVDPTATRNRTVVAGKENEPIKLNRTNFSPMVRFSYKPDKTSNLRIDYRGRTVQPQISQLAPVQDVTNPLISFIGNPSLNPSYQNNLFIHYNTFFPKKKSSLALVLMGNYVMDDIVSASTYDIKTGKRTVEYRNVDGNWMAMFGGFFSTPIINKDFSLRLSSRNSFNNNKGFINGESNSSKSIRLDESLGLTFRKSFTDMTLRTGLRYFNVNNTVSSGVKPRETFDYNIGWEANWFLPKDISVEYDINYNTYKGYEAGFNEPQWLLNAGLSWSFLANKNATVRVKAYDIFNQQRNLYRNSNALSASTERTFALGRYMMVHFIYRFNIFGGGGSKSDMKSDSNHGFSGRGGFRH